MASSVSWAEIVRRDQAPDVAAWTVIAIHSSLNERQLPGHTGYSLNGRNEGAKRPFAPPIQPKSSQQSSLGVRKIGGFPPSLKNGAR